MKSFQEESRHGRKVFRLIIAVCQSPKREEGGSAARLLLVTLQHFKAAPGCLRLFCGLLKSFGEVCALLK